MESMWKTIFSLSPAKKKKVAKYGLQCRIVASTLSFLSAKAYKYIRRIYPSLPHPSTIRKWLSNVVVNPGTCKAALDILKSKTIEANKNEKKIFCSVMIDDMAIRKYVRWDKKNYTGFATVNNGNRNNNSDNDSIYVDKSKLPDRATQAMVILIVCVNGHWKIPVAYHFFNKLSGQERASIVTDCLEKLHSTGINIVSLTFDGAASNITMAEYLGA